MKHFSCIIILFFLGITGNAQSFLRDTAYDIQTGIPASIKIELSNRSKPDMATIFFIAFDKDDEKESIENFDKFYSNSESSFNKVKIVFHKSDDSLLDFKSAATALMNSDLFQKNKMINKDKRIIAGINKGGVLALYMAAIYPDEINKTAIFKTNYAGFSDLKIDLNELAPKIKGKIFIEILNEDKNNALSNLVDVLALNTGVMIYKVENTEPNKSKNYLSEFFKWITTDGNNYIIDLK